MAGIGGSGLFSGGLIIIATSLPKQRRARESSYYFFRIYLFNKLESADQVIETVAFVYVFALLGSIIAPILGGVLTEKASWRWCE